MKMKLRKVGDNHWKGELDGISATVQLVEGQYNAVVSTEKMPGLMFAARDPNRKDAFDKALFLALGVCKDAVQITLTPFKYHALGNNDIKTIYIDLESHCRFCSAATHYTSFRRVGDTTFICEGETEEHVHQVTCVGFAEDNTPLVKCNCVDAKQARQSILKHACN